MQCPNKKCHSPYWDIDRRVPVSDSGVSDGATIAAEVRAETQVKQVDSVKGETHYEKTEDAEWS